MCFGTNVRDGFSDLQTALRAYAVTAASPSRQSSASATVLHAYAAEQLPAFLHQRLRPAISDSGHWASAPQQHTCSYLDLQYTTCAYEAATSFSVCAQQFSYSSDCLCSSSSPFFSFSFFGFSDSTWQQQPQLIQRCFSNLRTLASAAAASKFQCQQQRFVCRSLKPLELPPQRTSDITVFQPQLHRQRSDGC